MGVTVGLAVKHLLFCCGGRQLNYVYINPTGYFSVNKKFTNRLKVIYIEMLCFKGIFSNQSLCEGVKCPKNVQNWKIKRML